MHFQRRHAIIAYQLRESVHMSIHKAKRRYTRLTALQWTELTAAYAKGGTTLAELADVSKVSIRAIQNQLAKTGTVRGMAEGEVIATAARKTEKATFTTPRPAHAA